MINNNPLWVWCPYDPHYDKNNNNNKYYKYTVVIEG